jgi:hypothetical protein
MSELRTLAVIAIFIGLIVGLTSLVVFNIPVIYSIILSLITFVMFLFIILWSSYVFVFK